MLTQIMQWQKYAYIVLHILLGDEWNDWLSDILGSLEFNLYFRGNMK